MRGPQSELIFEHLAEGLEKGNGFIAKAQKYIKKNYGYSVSTKTIEKYIDLWGMRDWLEDLRKELVTQCQCKTFDKAIKEGDNWALGYILNKWGHHVPFLSEKEEAEQSKAAFHDILEFVKKHLQSETGGEHNPEHSED